MGPSTPEPVGDYFAGPNHTLPTSGCAKFSSPLGVNDFIKNSSIISYSPKRLKDQSKQIIRFAEEEGPAGGKEQKRDRRPENLPAFN